MKKPTRSLLAPLLAYALAFPGAYEDHPWGESVAKVQKKVFVFLGILREGVALGMSVKLPESADAALDLPFCKPTGYGLGKSGWVSIELENGDELPIELLREWIAESYRAVAPKKLIAELDAVATKPAEKTKPAPKKRAAKAPPPKTSKVTRAAK